MTDTDDTLTLGGLLAGGLIGLVAAIFLGMILPAAVHGIAFGHGAADAGVIQALDGTLARLSHLLRGDFSDRGALAAVVSGLLFGMLIKVISRA